MSKSFKRRASLFSKNKEKKNNEIKADAKALSYQVLEKRLLLDAAIGNAFIDGIVQNHDPDQLDQAFSQLSDTSSNLPIFDAAPVIDSEASCLLYTSPSPRDS